MIKPVAFNEPVLTWLANILPVTFKLPPVNVALALPKFTAEMLPIVAVLADKKLALTVETCKLPEALTFVKKPAAAVTLPITVSCIPAPTYKLPPIPTPPETFTAPVV